MVGLYWLIFLGLCMYYIYQMHIDTFDRYSWNTIYGLFFIGFVGWIFLS